MIEEQLIKIHNGFRLVPSTWKLIVKCKLVLVSLNLSAVFESTSYNAMNSGQVGQPM